MRLVWYTSRLCPPLKGKMRTAHTKEGKAEERGRELKGRGELAQSWRLSSEAGMVNSAQQIRQTQAHPFVCSFPLAIH